jgi:hypothetical protein
MDKTKISILAITLLIAGAGITSVYADSRGHRSLTDEQKEAMQEVKVLFKDGKYEEAKVLAKELGLKKFRGFGKTKHMKMMGGENMEAVKEAVRNNDYSAFQELISDKHFAEKITEEVFSKMVEVHSLVESGDKEGAREIMKEFGMKKWQGYHRYSK